MALFSWFTSLVHRCHYVSLVRQVNFMITVSPGVQQSIIERSPMDAWGKPFILFVSLAHN